MQSIKRVNLKLPSDLHRKAKLISVVKQVTLNQYLESLIQEAIARDETIIKQLISKD
ncbi:hypothetical protein J7L02_01180 [Candidatus Woesearchaeota archaeon]|nr:hypothetical protein [Candidatus Woesearchaeota archaeon]